VNLPFRCAVKASPSQYYAVQNNEFIPSWGRFHVATASIDFLRP
jgi:hypothetical protein